MTGLSRNAFVISARALFSFSRDVTATEPEPLIAIAFKFFDPMTAPTPFLPAALISLMIADILLKFSPAGPMQAILMFWSFRRFLRIC